MKFKHAEEAFFRALMTAVTASAVLVLIFMAGVIIIRGSGAMNLDMLIKTPDGGYYLGKRGGILNAIIGSLSITAGAIAISFLISLPIALYCNVYARKNSRFAAAVAFSLDLLWGVPSIVYGAFGFAIMTYLSIRASMLGGMVAVGLLIFPYMARAMDESIKTMTPELAEASYALGATRLETAFRVVLRQSLPGIIGAVLISFGRGIGDAASLIFTAGYSDNIPGSLLDPIATLPLAIFFQLGSPIPEVQDRAYASALILMIMVLIVSAAAKLLTGRLNRNIIR
jgi:phosphate transport system permease protein